jgi:hypothetical protein
VSPEGGAALGYYRGAPVVLLYAPDKVKFEAGVVSNLRKNFRISPDGVSKLPKIPGGVLVNGKALSFAYAPLSGGLVVIVGRTEGQDVDCQKILGEIVTLEEESSLGASPSFLGFKKEVGEKWPTSIYINTPRLLSIYKAFNPGLKTFQKEMLDAVAEQLRWTGVGGRADKLQAQGRIFFGVDGETLTRFQGLDKAEAKSPRFKMMVGEKAYAFLRSSVNADIFWKEYFKLMPARQQRYFKTIVDNLKSTTSIDLEKDLVENVTGHVGVAIYGINPMAAMARRAAQRMTVLTLAAHIQLKDPVSFGALLDRLVKEMGGSLRKWAVPGGIVGYGFDPDSMTAPPFALYLKDDVVTLASTSLSDERMAGFLLGEGPKLRRSLKGDNSVKLLEAEAATGVYINMPRVQEQIGILGGRMLNNLLGTPREVSVLMSMADGGISAEGSVTFNQGEKAQSPPAEDNGGAP